MHSVFPCLSTIGTELEETDRVTIGEEWKLSRLDNSLQVPSCFWDKITFILDQTLRGNNWTKKNPA